MIIILCISRHALLWLVYNIVTQHDSLHAYDITSGDENHLCGASLRKSHKISLKAHRHAYAQWVGTPIARPEKLPRQRKYHRLLV